MFTYQFYFRPRVSGIIIKHLTDIYHQIEIKLEKKKKKIKDLTNEFIV